jgi:hypothetical protein
VLAKPGTAAERRQESLSSPGIYCHHSGDCSCCRVRGWLLPGTVGELDCSSCKSAALRRGQSCSSGCAWLPLCDCSTVTHHGHGPQHRSRGRLGFNALHRVMMGHSLAVTLRQGPFGQKPQQRSCWGC